MNDSTTHTIISLVLAVFASTGFWSFLQYKLSKKSNETKLLLGLAHDRILDLGEIYITRGWLTGDEYENLHDYLYVPYKKAGGNGAGDHVMHAVDKLPIQSIQNGGKHG